MRIQLPENCFKQLQAVRNEKVGFEVVDILVGEGVHDAGDLIGVLEADAFECVAETTNSEKRRDALQQLAQQGEVVSPNVFLPPRLLEQLEDPKVIEKHITPDFLK